MTDKITFWFANSCSHIYAVSSQEDLIKCIISFCNESSNDFVYQNPFDKKWRVVQHEKGKILTPAVYIDFRDIPQEFAELVPNYKELLLSHMNF